MDSLRIAPRIAGGLLWAGCLLTALSAQAQMHRTKVDGYILQASTTDTENIEDEAARRFGIERGPGRAVINVTVLDPDGQTVPAAVAVQAINLAGMKRTVPMTSTAMQGWISYAGGYEYSPREVIDFVVRAHPEALGKTLTLRFRDRLPVR